MDKETVRYIYIHTHTHTHTHTHIHTHTHTYTHTLEYYTAIKNNKIMAFADKWMQLQNIMLSEISLSEKTKGRMISLISG